MEIHTIIDGPREDGTIYIAQVTKQSKADSFMSAWRLGFKMIRLGLSIGLTGKGIFNLKTNSRFMHFVEGDY